MQVYTTKDYSIFKSIDGNRTLNQLHLKRLVNSIKKKYLFTTITVNEKYEIIDGQHRFEAIKELGLELNYIICKGYGLDEVHILNQVSKTWTSDDYMTGYADLGQQDYQLYITFKERFGFGHNECMAMLQGYLKGGGFLSEQFKNGLFKITHWEDACEKAQKIHLLKSLYNGYNRRAFVYAMLALFKKPQFDFNEFLQKLKMQPTTLKDCVDTDSYTLLIEEIYNYRRKEKVSLRY